ncbi:SDR family oxidoreductase [candidate division KSB1 bacterium]|nr:SDR family oxidoreductase [candidate division KSB1 bacterium]
MRGRTVVVTGCSSGIGRATATLFAESGFEVVATARRQVDLQELAVHERIHVTECDVSDEDSVRAAIEFAVNRCGGIDVLINNAGFALVGPVATIALQDAQHQLDVNTLGPVRVTQHALPHLLKSAQPRVIQISSIGGRVYIPLAGWYSASKFALEGLNDALRFELEPLGVKVVSILPGPVHTQFLSKLVFPELPKGAPELYRRYQAHYGRRRDRRRPGAVSAEAVARIILSAALSPRPKSRYFVTAPAKLFNVSRKFLPDRVWDYLTKRAYGFDKVEREYFRQHGDG